MLRTAGGYAKADEADFASKAVAVQKIALAISRTNACVAF